MYQELQKGWIEVICGPMFAGKSEELIRRIKTLSYAHQKIIAYTTMKTNASCAPEEVIGEIGQKTLELMEHAPGLKCRFVIPFKWRIMC